MKKRFLKSVVFSIACLGMLAGVGAAVSAQPAKDLVKAADEYTTENTSVNGVYFYYQSWLVFNMDGFAGNSATAPIEYNSVDDFNFREKAYLNGDPNIKAFDTNTHVCGYGIVGANAFWSAPNPSYKANNFLGVKSITIPAGTSFPSYATVSGTEKVKYVTTEDVTFYNVGWSGTIDNLTLTKEDKVTFVDSEVEMFSVNNPNAVWPGFKLSVNDYGTSQSTITAFGATALGFDRISILANDGKLYNYFDLAKATHTSFLSYNSASVGYISSNIPSDWNKHNLIRAVIVPAGTMFPSLQYTGVWNQPTQAKTIYRTTKDAIFYASNISCTAFEKANPTYVSNSISKVGGLGYFDQGGSNFTNFVWNMETLNQANTKSLINAQWALAYSMSFVEFYDSTNALIDLANSGVIEYSHGAMFADFSSGDDYLVQIKTDKIASAAKIVFKAGMIIPSSKYLQGTSTEWYKLTKDQTFIVAGGQAADTAKLDAFVNDYMHPEIAFDNAGTGECTTSNWYTTAKTAFAKLSVAEVICLANTASYYQYFNRLKAWALANGEMWSDQAFGFVTAASTSTVPVNDNNVIAEIIVVVSLITICGATILLKKKKFLNS